MRWLHSHHVKSFSAVTDQYMDAYLRDIVSTDASSNVKSALLVEVRRLWSDRDRLPKPMRGCRCSTLGRGAATRPAGHRREERSEPDVASASLDWKRSAIEMLVDRVVINKRERHFKRVYYAAGDRRFHFDPALVEVVWRV